MLASPTYEQPRQKAMNQHSTPPVAIANVPRQTNWWALGALAAAAILVAVFVRSSRPVPAAVSSREEWQDLHAHAGMLRTRGSMGEAVLAARAAVELAPKAFGPGHFAEAESLNLLALIYSDVADYEQALAAYEQALPIIQGRFGPQSKEVIQIGSNLGQTLMRMGRFDEAQPIFEQALEITEKTTGPESLEAAAAVNMLAVMHDTAGNHDAARPLHERALAIRRRLLGPAHLTTVESMANLATSLVQVADGLPVDLKTGKSSPEAVAARRTAATMLDQVIAVRGRLMPADSPELATCLSGAAALARQEGRLDEAGRYALEGLAIRQARFGIEHPTTAISLDGLAKVRLAQGEQADAEEFFKKALDVRMKRLGPAHPRTQESLDTLAAFYIDAKRSKDAEQPLRQIIEIRERLEGEDALGLAGPLERLARVLAAIEKAKDADELTARAAAIREKAKQTAEPADKAARQSAEDAKPAPVN